MFEGGGELLQQLTSNSTCSGADVSYSHRVDNPGLSPAEFTRVAQDLHRARAASSTLTYTAQAVLFEVGTCNSIFRLFMHKLKVRESVLAASYQNLLPHAS
jgi:hypothetical protein